MDLNCNESIVEGGLHHYQHMSKSRLDLSDCSDRPQINMILQDSDLWQKFHNVTNEMMVPKSGRLMFPDIRVSIDSLEPRAMYSIAIEFVQIHRWEYMNGDWVAGGKSEPAPQQTQSLYFHPESPNSGAHWMKESVLFSKVNLTHKPSAQTGRVVLNSLHKYKPRVHVIRRLGCREDRVTFCFPETEFIAVTKYRNEEVTQLKIRYNPFAKTFPDARERPNEINNERAYNLCVTLNRPLQHNGMTSSLRETGNQTHNKHRGHNKLKRSAQSTAPFVDNDATKAFNLDDLRQSLPIDSIFDTNDYLKKESVNTGIENSSETERICKDTQVRTEKIEIRVTPKLHANASQRHRIKKKLFASSRHHGCYEQMNGQQKKSYKLASRIPKLVKNPTKAVGIELNTKSGKRVTNDSEDETKKLFHAEPMPTYKKSTILELKQVKKNTTVNFDQRDRKYFKK